MEPGANPFGTIAKDASTVRVDREAFPPNKKQGEAIPKVQAEVVVPKARRTKGLKRAIVEADIQDFKSWLVYDLAIPLVKTALMDALSKILFNQPYSPRPQSTRGTNPYWQGAGRAQGQPNLRDVSHDFIFDTKEEAQDVLDHARDWCNRTGTMTLGDFCRIAGLTPEPGDIDYGWYNFNGARVASYGDSWCIMMPRVRRL